MDRSETGLALFLQPVMLCPYVYVKSDTFLACRFRPTLQQYTQRTTGTARASTKHPLLRMRREVCVPFPVEFNADATVKESMA